jgi:hypothetical protein
VKYFYRYSLFWYILVRTFQQTCIFLRGRTMMKKHVAIALFAAITLVAASSASAFWSNNDRGGWDDEYDEWDPRYWMDEMEDFFDDDDDDYYRYGGGPYGGGYGPGPYGGGGYGPMPYGGGYGPGPGSYGGGYGPGPGGGGYGPAPYGYAPPAPQAAPAPAPAAPAVR